MKKVLAAVAVVAFLASCKKDYTCECTYSNSILNTKYEYKDMKKKDAEEACDAWDSAAGLVGGSCELN